MIYSIDTSALLDGWVRYYPPDIFPSLWTNLEFLIDTQKLIAIEEVLVELKKKDDEVYKWAYKHHHMFMPIDNQIQTAVSNILNDYERLVDTSKNRSTCDPFVIALAQVTGCVVVTGERATGNLKKPRIPDVCVELGIESINLLQLIRKEGWIFR